MALPIALMLLMSGVFFSLAWRTWRADPAHYESLRRRAKSPKHVVLGMVEPADGQVGGMAYTYRDGEVVIIPTCQFTDEEIERT